MNAMDRVRRPLILLAIAAVMANAHCVAMCAVLPCHATAASQSKEPASLPPCHRRHNPKRTDAPKPCASSLLVADARNLTVVAPSHSGKLAAARPASAHVPLMPHFVRVPHAASLPPPPALDPISVLRI